MSWRSEGVSEKLSLFVDLKRCCERILTYPSLSIWNIYGGINEFIRLLDVIFQHRVKTKDGGYDELNSSFLSCLGWLRPVFASELRTLLKTDMGPGMKEKNISSSRLPSNIQIMKRCLVMGALYECVSQLVQDRNIITLHYDSHAFLNDSLFATGLVLCIRAVEQKSSYFLSQLSFELIDVGTVRCRFTEYNRVHSVTLSAETLLEPLQPSAMITDKHTRPLITDEILNEGHFLNPLQPSEVKTNPSGEESEISLKNITNLPDVVACTANSNSCSKITAAANVEQPHVTVLAKKNAFNYAENLSPSRKTYSDPSKKDVAGPSITHRRAASDMALVEAKRIQTAIDADKLYMKTNTSSLMQYLRQEDLTTCEDIKKENAHFHLSEMLITVMEEKKCKLQPDLLETRPFMKLKQCETAVKSSQDEAGYHQEAVTNEIVENLEKDSERYGYDLDVQNDQEPMLSLPIESTSAESIAIELLKTFSSDTSSVTSGSDPMDWLVSENDVPQALLPIPNSTMIDPETIENEIPSMDVVKKRVRGNENWAPLRFQLIFNVQKNQRSQTIANQKYMCAGCGAHVEKAFIKRFRYCEYTGKYFCSCCHNNSLCVIPAHIFTSFNFKKYGVSNFSYDLLKRIHDKPLFNIDDINPSLYSKSKSLNTCLKLRIQAIHLMEYLDACRHFADLKSLVNHDSQESDPAREILDMLNDYPLHILKGNVHVYSIEDLLLVKNGKLIDMLKNFIKSCSVHVNSCHFCLAKGFICEICGNVNSILFPHQIKQCFQCPVCRSCYHLKCFSRVPTCPKCARKAKWVQINNVSESGPDILD